MLTPCLGGYDIIQLCVHDFEAALEDVKTSASAQEAIVVELKAENEALTKLLNKEKKAADKKSRKWQKTLDELTVTRNHVAHQELVINELSKEIDAHEAHFSSLKEELDKTKTKQEQLEGNISSWLKDLEITVCNY